MRTSCYLLMAILAVPALSLAAGSAGSSSTASLPPIVLESFSMRTYVQELRKSHVSQQMLRDQLNSMGIAKDQSNTFVSFVGKMQKAYPKRPVSAEFLAELKVQELLSRDDVFWATGSGNVSNDISSRRHISSDFKFNFAKVLKRMQSVSGLPDKALGIADVTPSDMFLIEERIGRDQVGTFVKVNMAKSILGASGKISNMDDLVRSIRDVVPENPYFEKTGKGLSFKEAYRQCLVVNPNASSKLAEKGIFSIPMYNYVGVLNKTPSQANHCFLHIFHPLLVAGKNNMDPLIGDWSVCQFVTSRDPADPFVGTSNDLSALAKKADKGGMLDNFWGSPTQRYEGVTPQRYRRMVKSLHKVGLY